MRESILALMFLAGIYFIGKTVQPTYSAIFYRDQMITTRMRNRFNSIAELINVCECEDDRQGIINEIIDFFKDYEHEHGIHNLCRTLFNMTEKLTLECVK